MKTTLQILTALVLAGTLALHAQEYRGIEFGIEVTSAAGMSQYLVMGVRDGATSDIDPLYQEYELPPFPPSEIFDVRFIGTAGESDLGSGSLKDYRGTPSSTGTFTASYTVAYQAGYNASAVVVMWENPLPSRVLGATIEGQDMSTMTEYTTEFAQGQFVIELTMTNTPLGLSADPSSLSFNVTGSDPTPHEWVDLTCENDKDAVWEITKDIDWVSVSPMSGAGDASLKVTVNPTSRPDGQYNGTITVYARLYDVSVDIPVTLSSTDVPEVPQASGLWLGQNYPNPFGQPAQGITTIPLALGRTVNNATLVVYDVYGRKVRDLSSSMMTGPGIQYIEFSGQDLPPGMYWYKLTSSGATVTRMLLLMR